MKNRDIPLDLLPKLREANENLVIASLHATEMQEQAEFAIHRQKEFLSMLAHELRNPLGPIGMAAEMLERTASTNPQLPQLTHIQQIIARQVSHMKRLLEDLLDASRVSTGKVNLKQEPLLLADIVRSAAEIAHPVLDSHQHRLLINLPAHPIVIKGDAVRLAQAFSNLLINASKYTPSQEPITLSASLAGDGMVEVSVLDRGVGIEPHLQSVIFDLFTQAPRTLARSEGGLGIGLSMVRSLVEMHGGSVRVKSQGLGKGSEFTVRLPVSFEVVAEAIAPADLDNARSCRILVIEDNVDGNETINLCLTLEGHSVDSAFDGVKGLALARQENYDLILCDIGLPGMDGYEVVKQVKASAHDADKAPCCIAMTGYDRPDYREHALQSGFDHYLVKPVAMSKLLKLMAQTFPLIELPS